MEASDLKKPQILKTSRISKINMKIEKGITAMVAGDPRAAAETSRLARARERLISPVFVSRNRKKSA
jgi:hypothetical protein